MGDIWTSALQAPLRNKHQMTVPKHGRAMPSPAKVRQALLGSPAGNLIFAMLWPCHIIISAGNTVLSFPKWTNMLLVHIVWFVPCSGVKFFLHGFWLTSTTVVASAFKISPLVLETWPPIFSAVTKFKIPRIRGVMRSPEIGFRNLSKGRKVLGTFKACLHTASCCCHFFSPSLSDKLSAAWAPALACAHNHQNLDHGVVM